MFRKLRRAIKDRRIVSDRRWCSDRRIDDVPIDPDHPAHRRGRDRRSGAARRESDRTPPEQR